MKLDRMVKLNNGIEMDRIGLGCWESRGQEAKDAVCYAVNAGYRRIDDAMYYENEREIGEGIRACGVPRDQLFIADKIWYTDMCDDRQEETFYKSLENLGLDYVDLYYLHWPIGEVKASWRVLEKLYEAGKVRAIAVCNFTPEQLRELISFANVCPCVNQFESNPRYQQDELRRFCLSEGIVPEAWGPFGKGRDLDLPLLTELAAKYEKTNAQIILRWHLERGMTVIPKSVHRDLLIENMDIWDFELEEKDVRAIDSLETGISHRTAPKEFDPHAALN